MASTIRVSSVKARSCVSRRGGPSGGVKSRNVIRRADLTNYEPVSNGPESHPVPEFCEKTIKAFPEKAIANHEEARVLLDNGYVWLDVRSKPEHEEERIVGSVNIPLFNCSKKYDSEVGDKVLKLTGKNDKFVADVEKKFRKKDDVKLLVGCSDGRNRAIQCLQLLDEAGYTQLVGVKGGFNKFFSTFDAKGRRRVVDTLEIVYEAEGTPAGIHDAGAHFDRMDAPPIIIREDPMEWPEYAEYEKANA